MFMYHILDRAKSPAGLPVQDKDPNRQGGTEEK